MSWKKRLATKPAPAPKPPEPTSIADVIPNTVLIKASPEGPVKQSLTVDQEKYEADLREHFKDDPKALKAALARSNSKDFKKLLSKALKTKTPFTRRGP